MKHALPICISLILALSACSHAPKNDHADEMAKLQEQLKATVVKALSTRPDFKEVSQLEIIKTEQKSGVAVITYKLVYKTQSADAGLVEHAVESEVTLERTAERSWTVRQIKPQAQSVVFHEPSEIIVKKKK